MKIQNGALPITPDHRDYDFHKTFGGVTSIPDSYLSDAGLTMPDQNADGYPNGCVRYTTTELCNDEDKCEYDREVVFHNMEAMGVERQAPADVKVGLKSVINFGIAKKGEDASEWSKHRRGAYYAVDRTTDIASGIAEAMTKYTALWNKPCSVSVGSPWYYSFENIGADGIISMPHKGEGSSNHNYKICGWKPIHGKRHFIIKSWQGAGYGDKGYCYMPDAVINHLLTQYWTGAYVLAPFTGDTSQVRLDYLEYMIGLLVKLNLPLSLLTSLTKLIQQAANTIT